jgi:hypothetical protein
VKHSTKNSKQIFLTTRLKERTRAFACIIEIRDGEDPVGQDL